MVWRDGILLGSAVTRPSGNRRRLPAKCVRGVAELVCRRSGCEAVAAPGRIRLQSPAREGISAAATRSRTRSPQRRRTLPAMSALAGIARFPRARLGHAPTPLETAPNLGAALGIDLYVKRDDCTGLAFGGNKLRQLEFHFGEARARDADTVLVTGAVQSNLVRIAAAAARRLGMEIHIQLEDRVVGVDDLYRTSGNLHDTVPGKRRVALAGVHRGNVQAKNTRNH